MSDVLDLVPELVDTKVVQPEVKPEVKPDAKPDAEVKPDAKQDAKPDAKPDVKPDVKPDTKPEVKATWPENWREDMAGGDAKKLAKLQRYASPTAAIDAGLHAQAKISSGEYKIPLAKDAKPEEVTAWREANGIPDKPEGYDLKLENIEIGEQDKPLLKAFLESAHSANMTKDQVKASLGAYYGMVDAAKQEMINKDATAKTEAEDALRAEWGTDYRRHHNMIKNLLDTAPGGLKDKLLLGRLSDGTPIGSSPDVLKFLAGIALERNPSAVITPYGVAAAHTVDSEIASIEKTMATNRSAYVKDEKMQARYRELISWRDKQK